MKIIATIIATFFTQWKRVKWNHCVKVRQFVNLVFHQWDQSLAPRTSVVSPPRFVRLAASRSCTMPVSVPTIQLLLFFVYLFFFGQRIRLFPREHVEFPAKRGRKEACAAGENCQTVVTSASVCRWLMAVIFLRIRWPDRGRHGTYIVCCI